MPLFGSDFDLSCQMVVQVAPSGIDQFVASDEQDIPKAFSSESKVLDAFELLQQYKARNG